MESFKKIFSHSLVIAGLISSIVLFLYANRISYVPIVNVVNPPALLEMISHTSGFRYMFDLMRSLVGVILFSLACLSLGMGLLRKWAQPQRSGLAFGVTAFLVGEILFSLIFLTVISLHRLTPMFVGCTLLFSFLAGFPALRTFITQWTSSRRFSTGLESSERAIVVLVIVNLIIGLLLSSTRLGYDAAADYFTHAKIMAISQLAIFFHPKHAFVVSSFHPGILFVGLIQLFGDQSARLLSWVNGAAILMMGLSLAKEVGLTHRARIWFLTLMVTSTAFVDLLGDGKIELISTAPILAAVYWMVQSADHPSKGTFTLIGLFAGFAIISRPYNIFLVSVFIGMFLLSQVILRYRNDPTMLKGFIQSASWIAVPVLILAAFHLFQNWVWLKSPIAPLIYARELDSTDWAWQLDPADLTLYRLLYPLMLSYSNSPQTLGNISPLVVGFLPFLLMKNVRENVRLSAMLKWLTLIATLTLLIWITLYFTVLEIRYVLFLWVILFLAMAQVLDTATQHLGLGIRPVLSALVIALLTVMSIRTLLISLTAYLPNQQIRLEDCHDTGLCTFIETLNQPAAPGDRVFVLHAYRYYLRPDLFACSSRVDEYAPLESLARQNSPDFWVEAYRQGYRYIMFEEHLSERRYNFGDLPSPDIAPEWLNIKVLYSSPTAHQLIYELEATNPPIQPEISCEQNSIGHWQLTSEGSLSAP